MEKVKQIHLHENTEVSKLRKSCNWEWKGWNKIYVTKNREAKQCISILFHLEDLSSGLNFYFINQNHQKYMWFYFVLGFILASHHLKCLQRKTAVTGLCKTSVLACRNKSCLSGQQNLAFRYITPWITELYSEKSNDNWFLNGWFLPPNHCFLLITAELKQAACFYSV